MAVIKQVEKEKTLGVVGLITSQTHAIIPGLAGICVVGLFSEVPENGLRYILISLSSRSSQIRPAAKTTPANDFGCSCSWIL